jgi:hypothetical protein
MKISDEKNLDKNHIWNQMGFIEWMKELDEVRYPKAPCSFDEGVTIKEKDWRDCYYV